MKVRAETRTSSPGPTPATSRATCKAAVPLAIATAWRVPAASAAKRSKRSTKGPTDDTQPVSRHSLTYAHSLPPSSGAQSGITPAAWGAPGSNRIDAGPVALKVLLHPRDRLGEPFLQVELRG